MKIKFKLISLNKIPEKLGAISNPFPRYPAVTAPFMVSAAVNIATEPKRSHPQKIMRTINSPGINTAENNF